LWAVLTHADRKGNRWDPAEFFQTGVEFTEYTKGQAGVFGLPFGGADALDFGCGVGRLARALSPYFQHVVGVDISQPMINRGKELGPPANVELILNLQDDLARFEDASFDYVQTFLVLQHMHPHYQARYLAEFSRLLRPGGVLIFQITTHDIEAETIGQCDGFVAIDQVRDTKIGLRMFPMPPSQVLLILDEVGIDFMALERP